MATETLLSVGQVAEALQVQPRTVRLWIRNRKLPAALIGKSYRVRQSDLDAFIEARFQGSAGETDDEPLSAADVAAIREGIEDIKAGRTVTLDEFVKGRRS